MSTPARASYLAATLAACFGCLDPSAPEPRPLPSREGRPVLFIGNSLTYWNSLPLVVEALVDSGGGPAIAVTSVTEGDVDLRDHWGFARTQEALASRRWAVVVLQQGPSSRTDSRALLLDFVRRFDERIRLGGGTTALYQVWPAVANSADFDRALESYRLAAAEVNGVLFPAGEAWRAAWRRDPALALYDDGLHPSLLGTYLAALTMYAQLTGRSPVGLPARLRLRDGTTFAVPAVTAGVLQAAAAEAVAGAPPPAARRADR